MAPDSIQDGSCSTLLTLVVQGHNVAKPPHPGGAADLLMTTVLRMLRHTDLVAQDASVGGVPAALRGTAGLQPCLADHMAPFSAR